MKENLFKWKQYGFAKIIEWSCDLQLRSYLYGNT